MNKIEVVKKVGAVVVSVGVSAIIGNIIKVSTPATSNALKKFCVGVGGFVLASMVSDQAVKYTDQKFDETFVELRKVVNEMEPEEREVIIVE